MPRATIWPNRSRQGVCRFGNPHSFSGTPFAADGQSAVFYPVNWLFAVLPLASAFGIVAALHTFMSGLFFYLYGRRIGLCRAACLCGGLTWMFCGVQVGWAMWQVIDATLCWLPLSLYFWEGWRRERDASQALGLSVALGMALLAGHLQFAFYVWLIVGTYALFRIPVWTQGHVARFLPGLAGILLLGIGLASVQLFATADFLGQTARATTPYATAIGTALPPAQMILLLAPEFFGGQKDWIHFSFVGGDYYETVIYCGAAALAFACIGLRLKERGDVSRYWLAVMVLAVLIGCGTPVYALFFYGVPLFKSFHGLSRAFVLFDFAVAALCAQGVDRLASMSSTGRRTAARNVALVLVMTVLVGYRIGVTANGTDVQQLLTHDFTAGGIDHPWFDHTLEQIGITIGMIVAACAVIAFAPPRLIVVSVGVVALDMLLFASGINIGSDAHLLYPQTPMTAYVGRASEWRTCLMLRGRHPGSCPKPARAELRHVPRLERRFRKRPADAERLRRLRGSIESGAKRQSQSYGIRYGLGRWEPGFGLAERYANRCPACPALCRVSSRQSGRHFGLRQSGGQRPGLADDGVEHSAGRIAGAAGVLPVLGTDGRLA